MARQATARKTAVAKPTGAPGIDESVPDSLIDRLPSFVRRDKGWLSDRWRKALADVLTEESALEFVELWYKYERSHGESHCEYSLIFFDRETAPDHLEEICEADIKTLQEEPDYDIIVNAANTAGAIVVRRSIFFRNPNYTGGTPSPEAAAAQPLPMGDTTKIDQHIDALADALNVPQEQRPVFKNMIWSFRDGRHETTDHAKAKLRPENATAELPAPQPDQTTAQAVDTDGALAKVKGDATLLRQWHVYQRLLTTVVLPPTGLFSTIEEAKAGKNLESTYRRARARQAKLGIELVPKNDKYIKRVATAATLSYLKLSPKPAASVA